MPSSDDHSNWTIIVHQIAAGDADGFQQLYHSLRGMRFVITRQLGPSETDDVYHETVLTVYEQIRLGQLREPERLVGYARTIMARKITDRIRERTFARGREAADASADHVISDPALDPEQALARHEQRVVAERVLRSLPERDREILIRFYLREQRPQEIQESMGLSENQFRLVKSRAKARFHELCRAKLSIRKRPGSEGNALLLDSKTA